MMRVVYAFLVALWLVCLVILASSPEPARGAVTVDADGCDIVLHHDGATGVVISYDDPYLPISDPYDITNGTGTIDMLAEYGPVYPAGGYTAVWDDGTVDAFVLTCAEDYDPTATDAAPPVLIRIVPDFVAPAHGPVAI